MIKQNTKPETKISGNYCTLADTLIVFSEKYKTGVSIIDDQHRGLMGTINTLFYHMRQQDGKTVALPVLTAFKHYAGIHYNTEKAVLEFYEPDYGALYDMHHEELCKRLLKVESLFRFDLDPNKLLEYLKCWWLLHMENHREFFVPVDADDQDFVH